MASVCNLSRLRDVSMGDEELAHELVRLFLDDVSEQIEMLRVAVERADCDAASAAAHRMKGAGGNVGAEIFAAECGRLETAARNRAAAELAGGYTRIGEELARVRTAFEQELDLR